MRNAGRAVALALVLALGAAIAMLVPGSAANAAPQSLSVQPRSGPVGTPLAVSGAGCVGDVAIHVAAFQLPRGAFVVADLVARPDPAGSWTAQLPMPDAPAYVEATCDGVTALPVVVTPAGVDNGAIAPLAVTASSVVIELTSLVSGSEMLVLSRTGARLGAATAVNGSARVTLPRSLGPATVFATGLRRSALGVPLPYVPASNAAALPFAESPLVVARPRVGAGGTAVSVLVTGCPGQMAVRVFGQAKRFQDTSRLYTTRNATLAPPGRFSFSFPMPSEPAMIAVVCTQGAFVERAATITAPSSWRGAKAVVIRDSRGWLLTVQDQGWDAGPAPAAFTLAGVPVPLVGAGRSAGGLMFRVAATVRGPVLLLAEEGIPGEDASALQDSFPEAWFADLGPADPLTPPADPRTPPPADPLTPPADPRVPLADPVRTPVVPQSGPLLAETGAPGVLPAAAGGAAAMLLGFTLIRAAHRSRRPRTR